MEMYNLKTNVIQIVYKMYILKTWATLKLHKIKAKNMNKFCLKF